MPMEPQTPGKPRVSIKANAGKPPAKFKGDKPPRTGGFQTRDKWTGIYKNRFGYSAEVTPHNFAHLDSFNSGVTAPKPPKAPKVPKIGQ